MQIVQLRQEVADITGRQQAAEAAKAHADSEITALKVLGDKAMAKKQLHTLTLLLCFNLSIDLSTFIDTNVHYLPIPYFVIFYPPHLSQEQISARRADAERESRKRDALEREIAVRLPQNDDERY